MEEDDGSVLVGAVAKENAVVRSDAVAATFKDHMGTQYRYALPSGRELSPEECSAMVLKKVAQDAETYLGENVHGEEIKEKPEGRWCAVVCRLFVQF